MKKNKTVSESSTRWNSLKRRSMRNNCTSSLSCRSHDLSRSPSTDSCLSLPSSDDPDAESQYGLVGEYGYKVCWSTAYLLLVLLCFPFWVAACFLIAIFPLTKQLPQPSQRTTSVSARRQSRIDTVIKLYQAPLSTRRRLDFTSTIKFYNPLVFYESKKELLHSFTVLTTLFENHVTEVKQFNYHECVLLKFINNYRIPFTGIIWSLPQTVLINFNDNNCIHSIEDGWYNRAVLQTRPLNLCRRVFGLVFTFVNDILIPIVESFAILKRLSSSPYLKWSYFRKMIRPTEVKNVKPPQFTVVQNQATNEQIWDELVDEGIETVQSLKFMKNLLETLYQDQKETNRKIQYEQEGNEGADPGLGGVGEGAARLVEEGTAERTEVAEYGAGVEGIPQGERVRAVQDLRPYAARFRSRKDPTLVMENWDFDGKRFRSRKDPTLAMENTNTF